MLSTNCLPKVSVFTRFLNIYFNILSSLSFDFSTFRVIQNNHFCISNSICHIDSLVIYNLLYMTTFQGYMLAYFWDLKIIFFSFQKHCSVNKTGKHCFPFSQTEFQIETLLKYFYDIKYTSNYHHDELTFLNYQCLCIFLVLHMFLSINYMK